MSARTWEELDVVAEYRDPDRPAYSPDGVDLTLIREALAMTPLERLQVLQQMEDFVRRVHDANPSLRLLRDLEGS